MLYSHCVAIQGTIEKTHRSPRFMVESTIVKMFDTVIYIHSHKASITSPKLLIISTLNNY